MPDLFISYKSEDRPWAERLYTDLQRLFPTFDIFWDRKSILPGNEWRPILKAKARSTQHLALLWSDRARASNEVITEIEAFDQSKGDDPNRLLFPILLQGDYSPTSQIQGFADLKDQQVYDTALADLGLSKLATDPARTSWNRIVQMIGDAMMRSQLLQPVTLAIIALNNGPKQADRLDQNLDDSFTGTEPTLQEFLDAIGIDIGAAKARYGDTAFEWRPYGTTTIMDIMNQLRMEANANLTPDLWFKWEPLDVVREAKTLTTEAVWMQFNKKLLDRPSVLIVDPISLYHSAGKAVLDRLAPYAKEAQSVILSLSPVETPAADLIFRCLRGKSTPILTEYFLPPIPLANPQGQCGLYVRHLSEMERLIRCNLGRHYAHKITQQGRNDFNMAPKS